MSRWMWAALAMLASAIVCGLVKGALGYTYRLSTVEYVLTVIPMTAYYLVWDVKR